MYQAMYRGGGVSKNESCSESSETHFSFRIFEIGPKKLGHHKQKY